MITVQADANRLIQREAAAEDVAVMDSNESAFEYIADAITAISLIVVHAEVKYGPLVTDSLLNVLEGKTMRNVIEEKRGETADV